MKNICKKFERVVKNEFKKDILNNIWHNFSEGKRERIWSDVGRRIYQRIHTNIHTRINIKNHLNHE